MSMMVCHLLVKADMLFSFQVQISQKIRKSDQNASCAEMLNADFVKHSNMHTQGRQ